MDAQFIQLTAFSSGRPWYINPMHICAFSAGLEDSEKTPTNCTRIYLTGSDIPVCVKETPDKIIELLTFAADY